MKKNILRYIRDDAWTDLVITSYNCQSLSHRAFQVLSSHLPFSSIVLSGTGSARASATSSGYLGNPVTARGATPKASPAKAVPVEPPTKKVKTTERDLPQELIAVQKDKLEAALSLISNFHVLDIGLHEAYLGCGLLLEWTAHSDFPAESLTVDLVELITRCQARDVEATKAPKPKQRAILCGLLQTSTQRPTFSACKRAGTSAKGGQEIPGTFAASSAAPVGPPSSQEVLKAESAWLE